MALLEPIGYTYYLFLQYFEKLYKIIYHTYINVCELDISTFFFSFANSFFHLFSRCFVTFLLTCPFRKIS